MDNSYRPRQDPAVTVRFKLSPRDTDPGALSILVWTTTPWTLPSNLALAVGKDIEYSIYELDGEFLLIGAATVAKSYKPELKQAKLVGSVKGSDLVGRSYEPMFPYFQDNPRSFVVLSADFVDTEEGTGTVHLAPGFGEDDQRVCEEQAIPLVCPVDEKGRFTVPGRAPCVAGTARGSGPRTSRA